MSNIAALNIFQDTVENVHISETVVCAVLYYWYVRFFPELFKDYLLTFIMNSMRAFAASNENFEWHNFANSVSSLIISASGFFAWLRIYVNLFKYWSWAFICWRLFRLLWDWLCKWRWVLWLTISYICIIFVSSTFGSSIYFY